MAEPPIHVEPYVRALIALSGLLILMDGVRTRLSPRREAEAEMRNLDALPTWLRDFHVRYLGVTFEKLLQKERTIGPIFVLFGLGMIALAIFV